LSRRRTPAVMFTTFAYGPIFGGPVRANSRLLLVELTLLFSEVKTHSQTFVLLVVPFYLL